MPIDETLTNPYETPHGEDPLSQPRVVPTKARVYRELFWLVAYCTMVISLPFAIAWGLSVL